MRPLTYINSNELLVTTYIDTDTSLVVSGLDKNVCAYWRPTVSELYQFGYTFD